MAGLRLRRVTAVLVVAILAGCAPRQPLTPHLEREPGMQNQRVGHTATVLANGKVLVTGGWSDKGLTTAELYDPATGSFVKARSMLGPRTSHTATLLANGKVLIAGGHDGSKSPELGAAATTAELYNPETGLFEKTGSPTLARCT